MNYGQMGAMMAWAEEEANRRYEEELEQMNNYYAYLNEEKKLNNPVKTVQHDATSGKAKVVLRRLDKAEKEAILKERKERIRKAKEEKEEARKKALEEWKKQPKLTKEEREKKYNDDWAANKVNFSSSSKNKIIDSLGDVPLEIYFLTLPIILLGFGFLGFTVASMIIAAL